MQKILFLGYRYGNCGCGPVIMWVFILFPDRFFCFTDNWPPRLLFFIFWFQNAQKLWSKSLSSSSVPQRKHNPVSKSVSYHNQKRATSMLVTVYVSHNFEILVNDWTCWWPILYIEKVTNIMILSPTSNCDSYNCHHRKVTNMSLAVI